MKNNQPLFINTIDSLVEHINHKIINQRSFLIGIDGRPGSGKTTLAMELEKKFNAQTMYLDEFFIPQRLWPQDQTPRFPFFYFRYKEFLDGIKALAAGKLFSYYAYDFQSDDLSKERTAIKPEGIIIVEGVSALNAEIINLYDIKIWVATDVQSENAALIQRESGKNLELWQKIYLPSVDIYIQSEPWKRADIIYAGRGVTSKKDLRNIFDTK